MPFAHNPAVPVGDVRVQARQKRPRTLNRLSSSADVPARSSGALAFARLARSCLHAGPPPATTRRQGPTGSLPAALKPAAVLIPVIDRPAGLSVLFTERATTLRAHSGQIAFPGGQIDSVDDGALGAALREADEEVGLTAGFVEPLGYLDLVLTHTGYSITPVVALVTPDCRFQANPDEVADIFECPLAFLMDPTHHHLDERVLDGRRYQVYAMPYEGRRIWGITAGIVRSLYECLHASGMDAVQAVRS